jgi:hypothetical protein
MSSSLKMSESSPTDLGRVERMLFAPIRCIRASRIAGLMSGMATGKLRIIDSLEEGVSRERPQAPSRVGRAPVDVETSAADEGADASREPRLHRLSLTNRKAGAGASRVTHLQEQWHQSTL